MEISKNRDEEIKRLYLEMYHLLMAYASSVLEDSELAQEAVQETFRIACSKPEDLLSSQNPKGWVTNTLKNVLRNIKRSRVNLKKLLIALIRSNQWKVDDNYDEIDIDVLYSDLSEDKDYQLLKKIVLDEKTILEVANELQISVEACTKRVQRAKKSLKKKLLENEK